MTEPKDRSAIVLPFGKHKGSTVAELLVRDPAYAEWIVAQGPTPGFATHSEQRP